MLRFVGCFLMCAGLAMCAADSFLAPKAVRTAPKSDWQPGDDTPIIIMESKPGPTPGTYYLHRRPGTWGEFRKLHPNTTGSPWATIEKE